MQDLIITYSFGTGLSACGDGCSVLYYKVVEKPTGVKVQIKSTEVQSLWQFCSNSYTAQFV